MLLLALLVGCADPCYDACNVLYGQGEDVCGGPDVPVNDNGVTDQEKACRQTCRASVEEEDQDVDDRRERWQECVNEQADAIEEDVEDRGGYATEACGKAFRCGSWPCYAVSTEDGMGCDITYAQRVGG